MTSEQIEAALIAYLDSGAAEEVAGRPRACTDCPTSRAVAHPSLEYIILTGRTRSTTYASGGTFNAAHTPAVRRFIAAVDAEPGPTVTFGRCRQLWSEAKEAK